MCRFLLLGAYGPFESARAFSILMSVFKSDTLYQFMPLPAVCAVGNRTVLVAVAVALILTVIVCAPVAVAIIATSVAVAMAGCEFRICRKNSGKKQKYGR